MRVVHLIQSYPPAIGGSEHWCREICQRLAAAGDDVTVLTLDVLEGEDFWREPPPERRTRALGRLDWDGRVLVRRFRRTLPIPILHHLVFDRLLDRRLGIYLYGPHSIELYTRLLDELKAADVVHLHTIPFAHNLLGYVAARRLGKRVVITPYFHPGHPEHERRSHYWLLRRCDAVFALSEYERDHLVARGVDRGRVIVTGAGIDPEDYRPADLEGWRRKLLERHGLTDATAIVLFVGRKLEDKGIAVLIDAVRHLLDRRNLALLLAGPALSWFDRLYAGLSAAERRRIIDLGAVGHQDKVNLLHVADVLVLPSAFESFGIVFLEAWICGTPVIGSATGPMPGLIGQAGLTFESGDAVDLAVKIETLLADPERARAMAARGQERVRCHYTWDPIAAAVRRTYGPDGRTRVLIVSNLFPPDTLGGAELFAHRQATILREMGHDVEVFAGQLRDLDARSDAGTSGSLSEARVSLSQRDLDGASWNFADRRVTAEFARVLERFHPDVVHFHNLAGLAVTPIELCRRRGIPTVLTLHDYWGLCFKNTMVKNDGALCHRSGLDCLGCRELLATEPPVPSPVRNAHIALALHAVDRLIAPSRFMAERYAEHGIPWTKFTVLAYGVDDTRFVPRPTRGELLTLGFIGRLAPHKGVEYLLRAVRRVRAVERLRLLIAGEGEDEARLRNLGRELGLEAHVRFLGRVAPERMPALYRQLDVLVVPSIWPENSPLTISEAMASGIPVIASAVGGIGELVEDGATGFLVPRQDPAALAARIEHFLAHPEMVDEMGARGLAKIQPYSARSQVKRQLEIYREVAEKGTGSTTDRPEIVLYDGGEQWSVLVLDMLRRLPRVEDELGRRILLCSAALVDEETFRHARLLVIPSPGARVFERAVRALQRAVPLLVHDSVEEVKELCRSADGGLTYDDPETLEEGLLALLGDEARRVAMGDNGRRYVVTASSR